MKLPSREQCLEMVEEYTDWPMTLIHGNEAQIQALIHRAYKAGAEAMREEAALACDIKANEFNRLYSREADGAICCMNAIRNLKVEDV